MFTRRATGERKEEEKKENVTNRFLARIERILSIRVSVFPGATNAPGGGVGRVVNYALT